MVADTDRPLVGRARELELLRAVVSGSGGPNRCAVLLGGPGVGKSTLLAAMSAAARERGALVLTLHGSEAEQHLPYAGLALLLAPVTAYLSRLPGGQRAAIERVLGVVDRGRPKVLDVGLAASALIAAAAPDRAVALVVDDLAFVDVASQAVLAVLIRRLAGHSVSLLAAARTGYAGALAETGTVIPLDPLGPEDSEQLLLREHPGLGARNRRLVLTWARGNPLALVELPKTIPIADRPDPPELSPPLPLSWSLGRAFGGRTWALPPRARDAVLVAAAYVGTEVAPVLAAASAVHGSTVSLADLDAATAAGLLDVTGPVLTFRHQLTRSAVLNAESESRRRAAHAALGDALVHDPLARAWHCAGAAGSRRDDVADELEALAPIARARGSATHAVRYLERSADLTVDPQQRGGRYVAAALGGRHLGDPRLSVELLSRAAELPLTDLDQLRLAAMREVMATGEWGDGRRTHRLCEFADGAVRLHDQALALDLLWAAAQHCWWTDSGADARRAVCASAQRQDDQQADPRWLAAVAIAAPDQAETPVGAARAPVAVAHSNGLQADTAQAQTARGFAALARGDSPQAADDLRLAETELRRLGDTDQLIPVLLSQAGIGWWTGDWAGAEAAIRDVRRFGDRPDQPVWAMALLVRRAQGAALRGDLTEALELAGWAELAATGRPAATLRASAQLARGSAWSGVGRFSEAYAELRPLLDLEQPRADLRQLFPALMFLAEAAAHSAHRLEGRDLIARWAGRAATDPAPDLLVYLGYATAVLAEDDEAEDRYATALGRALHRWPFVEAMLQSAYGGWLRRQRRIVESRRLIRSALLTFDFLGARGWAARARSELAAAGERQETSARPIEEVLSPQQREIAHLAARGLSNREIAEQLYLSPRTVGSHLYRMFPKLGVTSRVQLVQRFIPPLPVKTGDRSG